MGLFGWLAVYSGAILAVSLFGGCVPFLGRVPHSRLQLYLSLSAGVMLGACFFHVMPDAMELAGAGFGWWMALGAVGLFCIERFIAPHSHEVSSKLQKEHDHELLPGMPADAIQVGVSGKLPKGHDHEPGYEHDHEHRAAPALAGWMAVLGLTIHTFMNGVGLAGAVLLDTQKESPGTWALPGLALFLAIALHKPADALAISTVLSRKGVGRGRLTLVQLGFATMVPVGAAAFLVTREALAHDSRLQGALNQLTGAALAFSAGTFLFIALSDLLPEVQFHRHDRVPLSLALVLGVVLMGGIALLEGHDHGGDHHGDEPKAGAHHHDDGDDPDGHHGGAPKGGPHHHDHD